MSGNHDAAEPTGPSPAPEDSPPAASASAPPPLPPAIQVDSLGTVLGLPDLESTLAVPPSAPVLSHPSEYVPGMMLGDYQLVHKIASGGMGTVWEARNTKNRLNLPVALKMIKAGEGATESDIQRFLIEARAVASLHSHSNIVKIYGIGTHGDQFYFAMQLIRGGSLKQKAAVYRSDHRAAARLMIQVAGAIAHAHRRGILHRDLKPDNILLDDQGHPFVTDFGLAKRVDPSAPSATMGGVTLGAAAPPPRPPETIAPAAARLQAGAAEEFSSSQTEGGSVLGTPSYMPPEQAKGQLKRISTLSDVYGLGAVLYELLTGRPPFVGTGPYDILARVINEPIAPPRKLDRRVDLDLEAICLKALEKEPKERYDTAESFARDLQRWVDGKPVHARPISWAGRTAKWMRREPFQAVLAGAVCLVLALAPLGVILQQQKRLAEARERAERAEAEQLATEKALAEESFRKSTETVDALVNTVESEVSAEPAMRPLRRKLLKLAVDHFENAVNQWKDDAHLYERARAHGRKAEFAAKLGDEGRPAARAGYENAARAMVALIDSRSRNAPAPEVRKWQAELANYYHDFGMFHSDAGDLERSLDLFVKGLRLREALCRCLEHGDPTCYDCLQADDIPFRAALGRSHGYLGDVYIGRGQEKEGIEAYRTSHKIRDDLFRKFTGAKEVAPELKFQLARSFGNLAAYERYHGTLDQALTNLAEAGKLQQELIASARVPDENSDTLSGTTTNASANGLPEYLEDHAFFLRTRGEYLIEADRLAEALPYFEESRKHYDRLIALKPGRLQVRLGQARTSLGRAAVLLGTNRADQAKAEILAVRAEAAKLSDLQNDREYRVNDAHAAWLEARIALAGRDLAAASQGFEAARTRLDALVTEAGDHGSVEDQSNLGEAMAGLGRVLLLQGKRAEAASWLKSAVATQEKALGKAGRFRLIADRLARSRGELARLEPGSGSGPGPGP